MKGLFLFILIIPLCRTYPFNITNTVIKPFRHISSYKILDNSLKSDPSILVTREFKTGDSQTIYYYIHTKNLNYGISDEWKESDFTDADPSPSPFSSLKSMQSANMHPFGASGEKNSFPTGKGRKVFLTSDLCPTSKHYARIFYDSLASFSSRAGKPVPFIIFFSGKWIERHPGDLEEIKKHTTDFIAGNHSYTHRISSRGFDPFFLISEVTNTERIMLENGILPSYIFRFPGLLYAHSDIKCLTSINIICLNANTWMGEMLKNGSILIVHSNGNAAREVESFTNLLASPVPFTGNDRIEFSGIWSYFRTVINSSFIAP